MVVFPPTIWIKIIVAQVEEMEKKSRDFRFFSAGHAQHEHQRD